MFDQLIAKSPVGSVEIDVVVIRKDGYREDLGRVAYWSRSMLKRAAWRIQRSRNGMLFAATPGLLLLLPLATFMTQAGEAITTNLVTGLGGTVPKYVGWGTGAGTTTRSDTTLFTEKAADLSTGSGTRVTGTPTQQTTTNTNDTVQVTGTITASGAGTVTNAGLFDGSTIGSNNLYMKGDFTGIGLSSGDSIAFTCKVVYTD